MEQLGGGGYRRGRQTRTTDRFLRALEEVPSPASPPVELSEHDIFTTASESSSSSSSSANKESSRLAVNGHRDGRAKSGILVALNDDAPTRSGSGTRPVFNHRGSASSAAATTVVMIPKRPPVQSERMRFHPQSAPVNVPISSAATARKARDLEEIVSEDEELDDADGMFLPPHEVVDARHSPMLPCSVLEGAGRTLKGRDLRQVRNAVWRKTGFLD